jgi:adenosylmethionine-8-amino-7-oxononanoate aminotransferase
MKIEGEIAKWKEFMKALPGNSEKEAFEEVMNHCRRHTMAAGASARPIVADAMFMSILIAHEKELREIKASLEKLNNTIDDERKLPIVPAGQT